MRDTEIVRVSKTLSKALRHNPGGLGISLDANGWTDVEEVLAAFAARGRRLTREQLDLVVATNDKKRFTIQDGRIRANQGHSIEVDLALEPTAPPALLFHGTAENSVGSILATGIDKGGRHHVHLSLDTETARRVGARHGRPVVLTVLAGEMAAAGAEFYVSANGVWLVEHVPAEYVRTP
ncbi:putative RNA 2'-phosphotransferase [Actinorhabdospora filicis]|uniref:Probable RNA 2'-phosphotransferase n=1 Tax=Actinorhabdospora filicis TaxID=1785913 RepID=A0A9W6SPU7_9ACTN|nr:RNA 2'-phosphotransferase [Actinorhabdospora filicis]GLZ79800.1 putative RNA 2'-phosphotransferase [Actinorhabdospora filicis]